MFLFGRKLMVVGALVLLPVAASHAASTNPWAMPGQNNAGSGGFTAQGGFNFGGGFGGGAKAQNFVQPQQATPQQPVPQQVIPQQVAPSPQFGTYPPLSNNNTVSVPTPSAPQQNRQAARPQRPPIQPYYYPPQYGYGGGVPYGNYFGGSPFGFGAMPFLNGGFGFNGNFGFNGFPGFVAPGPIMPGYANPYYGGYGQQLYRPPAR